MQSAHEDNIDISSHFDRHKQKNVTLQERAQIFLKKRELFPGTAGAHSTIRTSGTNSVV